MTVWDWLASPGGLELTHALIVLVTAAAGYLSFLAHRRAKQNSQMLNSHLETHLMDAAERAEDRK